MTEENKKRLEALNQKLINFVEHPWILKQSPFHIVGDIYFVGNSYVSCFLLDTEKGLILIDAAFKETCYLLFDNIRALGYNPEKIKYLLLSHGHFDHCGAAKLVQEYSGCEIYLGKRDHFFFTERPDLILFEDRVPRFEINNFYDYDGVMDFGNIKIRPILTPGHTPGTTTFLIETIHNGEKVTCAMHGGIGINGLTRDELESNGLPLSLQQDFLNSLEYLKTLKVDVVLASHSHQYNMIERSTKDDGTGKAFFDNENGWQKMLDQFMELMKKIISEN
ncbi:MAG: MBL fold metallo-hydrolase [Fusobacteriaceae bacterium]|jgi:metallo-beta-lactamase class B|nr:MBL fold metallo-hydrolase [Fusobacteriaceae bacterium]